ncbi:MAG TPA: TMEM175 family protein [Nocardioidaceae bacterium]|nr:TMEM175 family protein [Nocardioidaceae bacterium]
MDRSDDSGGPDATDADRLEPAWRFGRGNLEFDRLSFFTDAVFAIAMTLLVVAIEPPTLTGDPSSPSVMGDALQEIWPEIFSFFLAFLLLGRYWLAHHAFGSTLDHVDRTLAGLTLCYLAFVAFLPFPTALVGEYDSNALSSMLFAACLTIISGLETVMLWHAMRSGLTRTSPVPRPAYRYALLQSTLPTLLLAASIPIAFASTVAATVMWILAIPLGRVVERLFPDGARAYARAFRPDRATAPGDADPS